MNKQRIKQLIGNNAIILEIGAADGIDTKELMEIGRVFAFEPEKRNIEVLSRIEGINLYAGAVSDTDGYITFNRSRTSDRNDTRLSGSIMKPKEHLTIWPWIYFDETEIVPCITLDTFCIGMPLIDFIWCDVQGAEEKVILGGLETFKKVRYFYTEYSNDEQYEGQPTLERIMELLPDFEVLLDYGGDVLLKNTKL